MHYYTFAVNLDRCVRIDRSNIFTDLCDKVFVPNKTEDLNLSIFNMITGINNSNSKHLSCECKCIFEGKKCYLNQKWNNNKCRCICKNPKKDCVCEKHYIWNPATCSCKNIKHLGGIIDDSETNCDEIIEETKTVPTN